MKTIFAIAKIVLKELLRRKDAYVLIIITALLTVMSGSVHFFGDMKMVRYVKELCLLLVWISSIVIAVTLTARQIHAERESRTLFSLLAKPLSRNQLILGKFLGCWLACGAALFVFYAFFVVTAASRGEHWRLTEYFQAFWLHWVMLGIIVAMVMAGSLDLRRAIVQRHDLFCRNSRDSHARTASRQVGPAHERTIPNYGFGRLLCHAAS